ncbi:MAG: fructose-1,6-bisphosphatase [Desulfotalea sp.]
MAQHGCTKDIDKLAERLLDIEIELNSNIPTTLWISDLHGEGDRFKSILRGRFGMLYQTCKEALPGTFSAEKIQYLAKIIRKKSYLSDKNNKMDRQDVILCLVEILRYKTSNIPPKDHILLPEFRKVIQRLLSGSDTPDPIFEERIISDRLIAHLSHGIRQVLLDRIQILGDIFDRGSQPDKIIRIISSPAYKNMVDYVLGNHDILWMGAATGCPSLVAEAMRITCRYDHFQLLHRLKLNTDKLADFAVKTYGNKITCTCKAKTEKGRAMEKALAVIQFKLEEKVITEFPEFEMNSRLWLKKLSKMLETSDTQGLNDTHFPTIDPNNPSKLSTEENEIINDLIFQFGNNTKLKRLLNFFFTRGKTYHIYNNFLNIHALVPSTKEGDFQNLLGFKGKKLLEHIQHTITRSGKRYLAGEKQDKKDQALFFYLWCGPKSPFFGKHAMKTFERYFLLDENSHEELSLYWKTNMNSKEFKSKMQKEFGVKRVIYGHTPVDYLKGKRMASDDGVAINVDGGFAAAYYNRGHALVHTPRQLYGIILPTPEELKNAEVKLEPAPLDVEFIDEFPLAMKIKDTIAGNALKLERDQILSKIKSLSLA